MFTVKLLDLRKAKLAASQRILRQNGVPNYKIILLIIKRPKPQLPLRQSQRPIFVRLQVALCDQAILPLWHVCISVIKMTIGFSQYQFSSSRCNNYGTLMCKKFLIHFNLRYDQRPILQRHVTSPIYRKFSSIQVSTSYDK